MKEFGYDQAELLDPENARGYSFMQGNNGTVVSTIRLAREGFVEPLMNSEIEQATKEILRLQETDIADGDKIDVN